MTSPDKQQKKSNLKRIASGQQPNSTVAVALDQDIDWAAEAEASNKFICSRTDFLFSILAFIVAISFSLAKFYLLENSENLQGQILFDSVQVPALILLQVMSKAYLSESCFFFSQIF
jgi:hypothetical protein